MKKSILFILFCFLSFLPPVWAETTGEMALQAQKNYENKDYRQALLGWDSLRSLGIINGHLYYNVANAYWRLGEVGQALRYLLKAKRLDPRDSDIRANIFFIEEQLGEAPNKEDVLVTFKKIPWYKLSINFFQSLKATAILSALLFGLFLFSKIKGGKAPRKWIWPLVLLVTFTGIQLILRINETYFSNQAVVIKRAVPLLSVPSAQSPAREELKEGDLLNVRKKQGNYRLVKTGSGKEGWVQAEQIGSI